MSERATDFLPCPHCGSSDIRVDRHRGMGRGLEHQGEDVWSMCCYTCSAGTPNRYSREVLKAAWNRRAASEPAEPSKATLRAMGQALWDSSQHDCEATLEEMRPVFEAARKAMLAGPEPVRAEPTDSLLRDMRLFLESVPRDLGRGSLNGMRAQLECKVYAALSTAQEMP